MTMISNTAWLYETNCTRRTKEEEIALRNSDECWKSVEEVANGNLDYKCINYYRLVGGTAPEGIDIVYRNNNNLIPSGKVMLDYDETDWREKLWPQI